MTIWEDKVKERSDAGKSLTDRSIAIHEASHAVVAHVLGFVVTRITEEYCERGDAETEQQQWNSIVVLLAGLCGVARYHDKNIASFLRDLECFHNDLLNVFSILLVVATSHSHASEKCAILFGQAVREAQSQVTENWPAIERIADALAASNDSFWSIEGPALGSLLASISQSVVSDD